MNIVTWKLKENVTYGRLPSNSFIVQMQDYFSTTLMPDFFHTSFNCQTGSSGNFTKLVFGERMDFTIIFKFILLFFNVSTKHSAYL